MELRVHGNILVLQFYFGTVVTTENWNFAIIYAKKNNTETNKNRDQAKSASLFLYQVF